ncbi:N-acetylglucosamine-6-phosphate deacetylase [Salipiger sp. P9]|uniref:N-acetylglucosamine-6-phosphate deacetylase n=1 Tax=Salipiger pentaromativorans TaxID=2943193 RepID=UPI0021583D7D|nr:N-acetylglucosamine-6-phosphate deacetylase [Salipiger pentaromativorans]MCR8546369.1 N-acetylglucosamine-6-phosphate deacetylase [Salipiger pentaromativorans]
MTDTLYRGGLIFDGARLLTGHALHMSGARVVALAPEAAVTPQGATVVELDGDLIAPGYVDLQVNGGGGVMVNDGPTVADLARIATAHRGLGSTTILPTLITDTYERSAAAVAAVAEAVEQGVAGIGGLHLEGPHLSLARKGAHDPALIRAMAPRDLDLLCDAAARLPVLMVTVAPESVTLSQVSALVGAGVLVSLGHTDADYDTCRAYAAAGARCVTHLFNAMSQLDKRAPGLVGAALDCPGLSAGLIADGAHVHPAAMRIALAAKPEGVFLVTDAMAPAGTEEDGFFLNGRWITRAGGRLLLEDGTLAGADLDLTRAVNFLVTEAGVPLARALAMATSVPARLAGLPAGVGTLTEGEAATPIRLGQGAEGLVLRGVCPEG